MEPANIGSDKQTIEAVSFKEALPAGNRSKPLTWVRLCGQLGWLYGVGQDTGGESVCFVWQTNQCYCLPGMSPLRLACKVARLYDIQQVVRFSEAVPALVLEVVWLEVSCDDMLSVILRTRTLRP